MKIFIAGIMQGSKKGKGIQAQDYRQRIRAAVEFNHPDAKIVAAWALHWRWFGLTIMAPGL
jgi:hypothetical protein